MKACSNNRIYNNQLEVLHLKKIRVMITRIIVLNIFRTDLETQVKEQIAAESHKNRNII
jgi:hypothetical protein